MPWPTAPPARADPIFRSHSNADMILTLFVKQSMTKHT